MSLMSTMIKGVCTDDLFNERCENFSCDQLHLIEPIRLADAHFHARLLAANWIDIINSLRHIEQFIGISNNHQSTTWNEPDLVIPSGFQSKISLYPTYGIHPRYFADSPHNDLLRLRDIIQRRRLVAVGECGLDVLNPDQLSIQTEIFAQQIRLANEFHLPLILHCRQLDGTLLDILKKNAGDQSMKIQWHSCYSKNVDIYREFLASFPSSVLSIGGMCCHSGEKRLHRLIQQLQIAEKDPTERRFIFETDAPHLKSSSLLTPAEDNCPILGTLAVGAYVTKNLLKSDRWTENLKINTQIIENFFNLSQFDDFIHQQRASSVVETISCIDDDD